MSERPNPPHSPSDREAGRHSTVDRLVLAAADQIATRGMAATSARSIADAAGASASAINYNLGGIEHLFSSAFAHGAAQTADWIGRCEPEIAALPATPAGAALALEHVVAEWAGGSRSLALLYQEALLAGAGDEPVLGWTQLWRDFWLRAAHRFGLGEAEGRLMHAFFESEALYHLSAWSPALERAALRETCCWLAAVWLGGPPPEPTGALALAERTAGVIYDGALAPAAARIVEAAAVLVNKVGLGGLTHRAVAAQAGVTTGAVTHHFRTVEDLAAGVIRGQVSVMQQSSTSGAAWPIASADQLFATIGGYMMTDRAWGPTLLRRQLFLGAVRRRELAGSAAVIRFGHGGTVGASLTRLFSLRGDECSLYAGTLARLVAGSWYASSAEASPAASQALLFEGIKAPLLDHLVKRSAD